MIGSIEVGKLADLILYTPSFFGTKPDLVIKGGIIVTAMMGDANASIPTPQPVLSRPMFGANPSVLASNCLTFISQVSVKNVKSYGLNKPLMPVKNCRNISKGDMKWNNLCPDISVDPETYKVVCNGDHVYSEPAESLPMAQSVLL